jgi:alkyldihydroxyacetonephosphate synthase
MRRGATPAVLRLYDPAESARNFDVADHALLIVVDEGDPGLVDATMSVVDAEAQAAGGTDLGDTAATRWLERRNHIPSVADLVRGGLVVDTVEIAAPWSGLVQIYRDAIGALSSIEGTLAASAHQSHSYTDGACLYFTFAGRPAEHGRSAAEEYYRWAFDAVTAATMAHHGSISHHHGIGLNRARYLVGHLGAAFPVLQSMKDALDPGGILNPGKLGLADHFGPVRDLP